MTTIGVKPFSADRILPLNMRSYQFPHPSVQTFQLSHVKEGIFHPSLPSFRRMEMDTMIGKLPDQHIRTRTSCSYGDFEKYSPHLFNREPERLPALGMTKIGKEILKHAMAPDELRRTRLEWSKLLDRCPERYNIPLQENEENCGKDLEFSGYAVRYLRPGITGAWMRPLSRYIQSASDPVCTTCDCRRSHFNF